MSACMNTTDENKISFLGFIIWFLASLFFLYEFFLRTFVGSVANQIMDDLTLSAEKFALVSSAYYFTYAAMQIPVGMLVDKFGVRKILVFGTVICAISAFLFSHSTTYSQAFISRLIMGFGSSFAFICLLVIASTWFPRRYFAFFTGTSQFMGTMGPLLAAGPMVKLLIATDLSWQQLLDIIGVMGLGLALLIFLFVKNKSRDGAQVTIYLRRERPFLYYLKRLAKNPQVWYIAIFSALIYTSVSLLGAVWGTAYLEAFGLTHYTAANIISIAWLGYAIGCLTFGAISDHTQRRRPVLVFCAVLSVILLFWMILFPIHSALFFSIVFFLLGLTSAGQSVAFAAIAENVDLATKATALGINNAAITLLGSIIPIITGYMITRARTGLHEELIPQDFTNGFLIMPILYIGAVFFAIFLIKETYCKLQKEPIFLKIEPTAQEK